MKRKLADGEAAVSLPSISVPSYPAQDKNTVTGMVPPIAYSKVNAGNPSSPDAGAAAQKSMAPMGAQSLPKTAQAFSREDPKMNMTSRPLVQDLVKQAMSNAAQRAKIAAEGARQSKLAEEKCDKCDKQPCECKEKSASSGSVTTDYANKLAAALEYALPAVIDMSKAAETSLPEGVSASGESGTPPGPGQQGQGHAQPPMNPGTQKAMPVEQGATQLENTMNEHVPGEQQTAMSGGKGKTASVNLAQKNLSVLLKLASTPATHPYFEDEISDAIGEGGTPDRMRQLALEGAGGTTKNMRQLADWSSAHPVMNRLIPAGLGAATGAVIGGVHAGGKGALVGGAIGGVGGALLAHSPKERAAAAAEHEASLQHLQGGGVDEALRMQAMHSMGNPENYLPEHRQAALQYLSQQQKAASVSFERLAEDFLGHVKQAEDAINPAQISAGAAVPPDTSASGEEGGQPVAGAPQGPSSLIGSNESAINYKRQTAYAPRKAELAQYFNEPALSAATDKTLQQAFDHTGEAGVKISSQQLVKSAAARAFLAKLAEEEKEAGDNPFANGAMRQTINRAGAAARASGAMKPNLATAIGQKAVGQNAARDASTAFADKAKAAITAAKSRMPAGK